MTDLASRYDVADTVAYILDGGFRTVALQFPDEQLADSPQVAHLLQQELRGAARVFILADTAYNPLGVDEVAAQHLAADCVVHYGRASLCPVSTLPAFFVLPKDDLDVWQTVTIVRQAVQNAVQEKRRQQLQASGGGAGADGAVGYRGVVVLLDQAYQHALVQLQGEWGQQADQERQAAESGSGVEHPDPPLAFARVTARSLRPPAPGAGPGGAAAATAVGGRCGAGGCQGPPAAPATSTPGCCMQQKQQQQEQQPGVSQGETAPCETGGSTGASGYCEAAGVLSTQDGVRQEQEQEQDSGQGRGLGGCGGAGLGCAAAGSGGAANAHAGASDGASEGPAHASTTSSVPTTTATATNATTSMAGLSWELPPGVSRNDCLYVWVGPCGSGSSSAQQVLQLTHNAADWLSYDPAAPDGGVAGGLSDETRRLLKRRNFMVEKTRQANIVGILVGTLGSRGFLDVIACLRRLVAAAGKKSYTFLMGKPNPAKLGNFPEVDVFVMVADAQGLILDSRDYLAPLVTPWEAAIALSGRHLDVTGYRLDFEAVMQLEADVAAELAEAAAARERRAAAGGRAEGQEGGDGEGSDGEGQEEGEGVGMALQKFGGLGLGLVVGGGGAGGGSSSGLSLAARGGGAVAASRHEVSARTAAEYLALKRSYKGLEMPATGASPKVAEKAVEGLSGRAAVYEGER